MSHLTQKFTSPITLDIRKISFDSLPSTGGASNWFDPTSILDADFSTGRFRWNGQTFIDENIFLAAIGGSKSGNTRTIGPYMKPDSPELVTNGTFPSDATGWTVFNSGLLSSVSSQGSLEANNGANPSFRQQVSMANGKSYRYRGTTRRGTAPAAAALIAGNDANFNNIIQIANSTDTPVTSDLMVAWQSATMNVGGRITSGSGTGAAIFDDLSVKEWLPFSGMTSSAISGRLSGVTPAVVAGSKVALQLWGSRDERNRIRLEYDSSSKLRFIVTMNNVAQANLDLGTVAVSSPFAVEFSVGELNRIAARLNTNPSLADNSSIKPGLAVLSVARSQTGEIWDGSINRLTLWSTERLPTDMLYLEGDSYAAGSGGVGLTDSLISASGKAGLTTATGGSTLAQQLARVNANLGLTRAIFVHWDGDANGYVDITTTMANYASLVAAVGHNRFVIVPPCRRANNETAENTAITTIQSQLMSLYGATHIVDAQAILASHATSPGDDTYVANNYIPISLLQGDGTHLNSTGMGYVATAVSSLINNNNW